MSAEKSNPPIPRRSSPLSWRIKIPIAVALLPACLVAALVVMRLCGLLIPYLVPTASMSPAIQRGDHVLMEGITYLRRAPRRGDIVVFNTTGISQLPPRTIYVKRVVGEPGDRLRLSDGALFINDQLVTLTNLAGPISFDSPANISLYTNLTISAGCYFVTGDNSTDSLDSRLWGCLPLANIKGRVCFAYWPPGQVGPVR